MAQFYIVNDWSLTDKPRRLSTASSSSLVSSYTDTTLKGNGYLFDTLSTEKARPLSSASSLTLVSTYTDKKQSYGDQKGSFDSTYGPWEAKSLVGKALISLVEAARRGKEDLIARRKLCILSTQMKGYVEASIHLSQMKGIEVSWVTEDIISSQAFHFNPAVHTLNNAGRILDDLLELSRHDSHSAKSRHRAMQLIVHLVNIGETQRLLHRISEWTLPQIKRFLSEFMSAPCGDRPRPVIDVLLDADDILSYRILIFLCHLARLNSAIYELLFSFDLLDMITSVCAGPTDIHMRRASTAVLSFCNATLCTYPDNEQVVLRHPLSALWPPLLPLSLRIVPICGPKTDAFRARAWRRVSTRVLHRRLAAIKWELFTYKESDEEPVYEIACGDLLEFGRWDAEYEGPIVVEALQLTEQFVRQGEHCRKMYERSRGVMRDDQVFLPSAL